MFIVEIIALVVALLLGGDIDSPTPINATPTHVSDISNNELPDEAMSKTPQGECSHTVNNEHNVVNVPCIL